MKTNSLKLFDLQKQFAIERCRFASYASFSEDADQTRIHEEPPHLYRTPYQRDRDRIIHSRAFRRLKHKRQVFVTNICDHYRTRLTHTMEVSQLARTIARALGLNDDLAEAIAVGHDLGHTPFGHLGEVLLNEILQGKHRSRVGFPNVNLGGFKHNYQSLRVLDLLEAKYAFPGLNLTAPVREGILKHTQLKKKHISYPDFIYQGLHFDVGYARTLEGQVVEMADEIAQRTHDLEDGIRAGLVDVEDIRQMEIILLVEERLGLKAIAHNGNELYQNRIINGLVDYLVTDLLETTLLHIEQAEQHDSSHPIDGMLVTFSKPTDALQKQLNKFIYKYIIEVPAVNEHEDLFRNVLLGLYSAYIHFPEVLAQHHVGNYKNSNDKTISPRTICDHIAGMTDNFALTEYQRLHRLKLIREAFDFDLHQFAWMQ